MIIRNDKTYQFIKNRIRNRNWKITKLEKTNLKYLLLVLMRQNNKNRVRCWK